MFRYQGVLPPHPAGELALRAQGSYKIQVRCPRCFLKETDCVCAAVPRVRTRTKFVILRHAMEATKPSNTGRLAALAIEGAQLVSYGQAGGTPSEWHALLDDPGTWMLFPRPGPRQGGTPPKRLLVLDGSWPQARRMMQRISRARTLPCFSLPALATTAGPRMRRAPAWGGMATLEAIAQAVAELEGERVARPLYELYRLVVARSAAPSRGQKHQSQR